MAINGHVAIDINHDQDPQDHDVRNTTTASAGEISEEPVEDATSHPLENQDGDPNVNEELKVKLYKAAKENDWETVLRDILKVKSNSGYLTVRISDKKDTALHIAVEAKSSEFVKELVEYMTKEQLKIKNDDGNTAFYLAAANGSLELAELMFSKNEDLVNIRGKNEMLPVHVAAQNGHEKMVEFLYGALGPLKELDSYRLLSQHALFLMSTEDRQNVHLALYLAAFDGDWDSAHNIYKKHPDKIRAKISWEGNTALHIAASANQIEFVRKLVKEMKLEDVAIRNYFNQTALFPAAATGNLNLLQVMLADREKAKMILMNDRLLSLQKAASLGHKDIVEYLYELIEDNCELRIDEGTELLITFIETGYFASALQLIEKHQESVTACDSKKRTALLALSRKSSMSSDFTDRSQGGFWKTILNLFSGSKKKMHPEAVELVKYIWKKFMLLTDMEISQLAEEPVFNAAKQGNHQFLRLLIKEYRRLILKVDKQHGWSILHYAVVHRQEDIFNLIYEIGSFKDYIATFTDDEGNNMLHLAGRLAPPDRLNIILGEALQMQRELWWFKEVNNCVPPLCAEAKNKAGETPRDVFIRTHKSLKADGEKWIKKTASSCMLVATLITSVVFTATFQVPINNKGDKGVPLLVQKLSFAISLIFSTISITTFLSLYTSSYNEEDFLRWLPAKLACGILTLSTSIAAMMVIFISTFFIVFDRGMLPFVIIISTIAAMPLICFLKQQLVLLFQVIRSTYRSCISGPLFASRKSALLNGKNTSWKNKNEKKEN